jgi:hypothetical protein
MKRAFWLFAVLLLPFTPPAFGQMPELNVKAVCKARATDAKILRSVPEQSVADCLREEESAKQQLSTLWTASSVAMRKRCQGDARALGTTSYLDLLSCLQMAGDAKPTPQKATGKQ